MSDVILLLSFLFCPTPTNLKRSRWNSITKGGQGTCDAKAVTTGWQNMVFYVLDATVLVSRTATSFVL